MVKSEDIGKEVQRAFLEPHGKKIWALMLFYTEVETGISNTPNKWVNTNNVFYNNGTAALNAYSETPCAASQLVDGATPEELEKNMLDMVQNYKDDKWLEENLYPFM